MTNKKQNSGMKEKMTAMWGKTDKLSRGDLVLLAVIALFCFISYIHVDTLYTGNRSWIYYHGIGGFYDHVHEWTQDYGANYMPTTFGLFAIWNLPLKLLGLSEPPGIAVFNLYYAYWYKLLSLLFYGGSAWMLRKTAKVMGMGERKASVAAYAFMTTPFCFYSQFIFAQYDIITVFFVILGLYYYYRNEGKDMYLFSLWFGVAVTCKYFAVVPFVAMLVLREKRVQHIFKYLLVMAFPFLAELAVYYPSANFRASVLGFNALNYVSVGNFDTGVASISYTKLICVVIVLWAYFVYPKSKKEETAWSLYLSSGICFGIFAFSKWHPQWLIFMTPFWVLGMFISRHIEKFLWIDALTAVVFIHLTMSFYPLNADYNLLSILVWNRIFDFTQYSVVGKDFLPSIDANTTNSILSAVFLAVFLFKHPKYALDDFAKGQESDRMHLIRLRFLLLFLTFTIPAFLAAARNSGMF
ncbi:MAG: hypothetical protein Q4B22_04470 [Eubacteriales bacterium]|nr:hypothetical protein [Eubacteriales bacterium]